MCRRTDLCDGGVQLVLSLTGFTTITIVHEARGSEDAGLFKGD